MISDDFVAGLALVGLQDCIVSYNTFPLLVLLPPKDTFRVRSALQFRLFWLNFREGAVSAAFVFCSILVAVNV